MVAAELSARPEQQDAAWVCLECEERGDEH
jgi:hypothetical protein